MKILIIHTAFIGDIVLSTPLIKKIKYKYPDAKIDYLTVPAGGHILKNNPLLNEIIVFDKKERDRGIGGLLKICSTIKSKKYDLAYIPHRYLKSSLMAFLGGIKKRIGYNISSGRLFLTDVAKYEKGVHEVERLLKLVDADGFEDKKIEMFSSEKDKQKTEQIWGENGLYNSKVVVLAAGSKWFTKMWPTDYFNDLITLLVSRNKDVRILLVGGKEEKSLNLMDDFNGNTIIDLRGKTSLSELYEIMKRSAVVVTNDSSPIHIASATDAFIIAIFGSTVQSLGFYPWSKNSIVIENNNINCRPCGLHGHKKCPKTHFKCMREITPEIVYREILKHL